MARDITTAFKNAIEGSVVKPIVGIELEFSDGTLRFWNGYGNLTMTAGGSSKTFNGAGDMLGVSEIEESSTLSMSGVTLTLASGESVTAGDAIGVNSSGEAQKAISSTSSSLTTGTATDAVSYRAT